MRFYEVVTPLRDQLIELSVKNSSVTEELDMHRTKMKTLIEVKHTNPTSQHSSVGLLLSYLNSIHVF